MTKTTRIVDDASRDAVLTMTADAALFGRLTGTLRLVCRRCGLLDSVRVSTDAGRRMVGLECLCGARLVRFMAPERDRPRALGCVSHPRPRMDG